MEPSIDQTKGNNMVASSNQKTFRKATPWLFGLAALGFVPILIIAFGPDSLRDWLPAYWAGAAGGLMLELIGGGWGLEMPSAGNKKPLDQRFAPFGKWVDIGFFGRMATGALAAPVFLVLINVLIDGKSSKELSEVAGNVDTLAWAVLLGAASPSVWKAGEALVTARVGQLTDVLAAQHVEEGKDALKELAANPSADSAAQVKLGTVIGKLDSAHSILASGSGKAQPAP